MRQRAIFVAAVVLALGYVWLRGGFVGAFDRVAAQSSAAPAAAPDGLAKATFAAGCFWCVEADFDKLPGVVSTTSGYTGGSLKNPTYEQVSRGGTGHTEAVEIVYDPAVVTFETLVEHFWKNVDPFSAGRQFCDVGDQYRPAIFTHDEAQRAAAERSKRAVQERFGKSPVVEIAPAGPFYRAEAYHQDYYRKNPVQYRYYRWRCGRDAALERLNAQASTVK